ncbi:MAG: ATP-binding protein [Agriterribacter sp.]
MLFSQIIGQDEVKHHLLQLVHHNRLSHALLFLGKEGSGALPLALAFAEYVTLYSTANNQTGATTASLFGDEPAAADTPVHTTAQEADAWTQKQSAYVKTAAMIHPDIHYSYPVVPKKSGDKPLSTDYITEWRTFIQQYPYGNAYDWLQFIGAENKQGNITAYECNDIIRKLNLKSFESPYKILLMWLPEYLGNEGNKLLKLIEEPPANTLFLLVAENESLILPTILSRTQLVKVPAPDIKDITSALMDRAKTDATQARQIASVCEGNYREALQLLQHSGDDWQGLLREWLNAILKTGPAAQVKWIEEISRQGRERQKQFLRYFNHLLEQSIRLQVMPTAGDMMPEAERDFALRLNKIASLPQHQAIIEELDRAAYYIERNANAKILFHALTIKLYHIIGRNEVVEMR